MFQRAIRAGKQKSPWLSTNRGLEMLKSCPRSMTPEVGECLKFIKETAAI